ncbi:MAG: IS607 family transposase, partial [Candidatus Thermochlorobacter sp.]
FGFEQLQAALNQAGRSIIVVDDHEVEDDIVRDLHEIIVSLCARLYGKRAARNKANRVLKAIQCA